MTNSTLTHVVAALLMLNVSLAAAQQTASAVTAEKPAAADGSGVFVGGTGAAPAPIAGLYYTSGAVRGYTDASGRFRYKVGAPVHFAVGDVELGSVAGAPMLTPYSLLGSCAASENFVKMARFLYSLDRDGDAANGIQISQFPPSATRVNIAELSEAQLDARVKKLMGSVHGLVAARPAVDAFIRTLDGEKWQQVYMETFADEARWRSQGVSSNGDGWIFTTNNSIQRTDNHYVPLRQNFRAIPEELTKSLGLNHIGDADQHDGILYAPVEEPSYKRSTILLYDTVSLSYMNKAYSLAAHQAHLAWVAIDAPRNVAYSGDWDPMDHLNVYDYRNGFKFLREIPLGTTISSVQGAKVWDSALYANSNNGRGSVYKINLETGTVIELFSVKELNGGRDVGEQEGMAVRDLPDGTSLHTMDVPRGWPNNGVNLRHHRRIVDPVRKTWCAELP